jgi:hypothetical protein
MPTGQSKTPGTPSRACKHALSISGQLDVSFREDAARTRKDDGPGNIAVLRRRALDLVRPGKSTGSLSIKLKRAGWDDESPRSVLKRLAEA